MKNYTPFPTDLLPKPMRAIVTAGASAIGCDAGYLAPPALVAAAASIGNARRVRLKSSWSEPAIVWAVVVGESGTAKSPAMELILAPLKARQARAMRTHEAAMADYMRANEIHAAVLSKWQKNPVGDPPPPPDVPVCPRVWTDDATTEALGVLLKENPRGLLMACDEAAGWLKRMDQYKPRGGSDVPKWLEMFGGRSMMVDRRGSGPLYVPRAAMSVIGGIQPGVLDKAMGTANRENGLLARLLVASPPRKPKQWTDEDVPAMVVEAWGMVLDGLASLEMDTDADGDPAPRMVGLDPVAKAMFVDYYNQHNTEQVAMTGEDASAWSKLEGYAPRLALVVHMVRVVFGDKVDPAKVDGQSMESGIGLARWFAAEALRLNEGMSPGYSNLSEPERECLRLASENGGRITARELTHKRRPLFRTAEAGTVAMNGLVAKGFGTTERAPGGEPGRPMSIQFVLLDTKSHNPVSSELAGVL